MSGRTVYGLTLNQARRLVALLKGPSYLADEGFGWRPARAWFQTYQSLEERGLVRHPGRGPYPSVLEILSNSQAYVLTEEGRRTAEQIQRSGHRL